MKKTIMFVSILFLLTTGANAETRSNTFGAGRVINDNGCIMAPLRDILTTQGISDESIHFYPASKSIEIMTHGKRIFIQVSAPYMIVNDEFIALPRPAYLENGVTFVPLRAIAESLDAYVLWNESDGSVTLKK